MRQIGLVDVRTIAQCLGAIITDPTVLDEYFFEKEDFAEPFYMLIYSAAYNLYNSGVNVIDNFSIDSYLSNFKEQYKIFNDNNGLDYISDIVDLYQKDNFPYFYSRLKKFSCLRYWEKRGYDTRNVYDSTITELSAQEKEMYKLDNMSVDDMIDMVEGDLVDEPKMKFSTNTSHIGQLAGKNLMQLKDSFKEIPDYGLPLQSPIMSTIARGCRLKKLYLRSSNSGGGKAIPNDTIIPTPSGYRKVGDIKVGDYLFDRRGNPTKVLAVYPQPKKKRVYEITFSDGRTAECCEEHLWGCIEHKKKYRVYNTKELMQLLENKKRLAIPINKPVDYSTKQYTVPPYIMGLFLGDASFRYDQYQRAISYSSEDDYLPKIIANTMGWTYKKGSKYNYNYFFEYKKDNRQGKRKNVWVEEVLKDYPDLWNVYSFQKYIPEDYMFGDVEQRYELLRGLLDTDGSVDEKGRISFSTTSSRLKNDVINLCHSLGLITAVCVDKRDKYKNGEAYKIGILTNLNKKHLLFKLPKHLNKVKKLQTSSQGRNKHKHDKIFIERIEETSVYKDMTCFTVDNDEALFLMNDYIVTHNTRTGIADMANIAIPYKYNLKTKQWDYTGFSEPVLMISTELEIPEIQTILIAYISGVNESVIRDGTYKHGEEERVDKSIEYIESSPFYIEFVPDFGINDIEQLIRKYKREQSVYHFFFDYVHMSNKLIIEIASMSKGMKLREDQILFLFIDTLKNLCNKLGIFILSSTQLNGTYKDSTEKDETMLRGAKNMADRIDLGEISLAPSPMEQKMLKEIVKNKISCPEINLIRHVYKLRGNRWSKIKICQHVDLGTGRTEDVFVLDKDNKLIDIPVVNLQSINIEDAKKVEDIIQVNSEDSHNMPEDLEATCITTSSENEEQEQPSLKNKLIF